MPLPSRSQWTAGIYNSSVYLRFTPHSREKLISPSCSHTTTCFVAPSIPLLFHSRHQQFLSSASLSSWWLTMAVEIGSQDLLCLLSDHGDLDEAQPESGLCFSDRCSAPACLTDIFRSFHWCTIKLRPKAKVNIRVAASWSRQGGERQERRNKWEKI